MSKMETPCISAITAVTKNHSISAITNSKFTSNCDGVWEGRLIERLAQAQTQNTNPKEKPWAKVFH